MAVPESGLTDADLPGLFAAADVSSLRGQRDYVNAVRLRLLLVIGAALTGVLTWKVGANHVDFAALGTAVALAATASVELYLKSTKPEELWYDGRALAESAKSLAWRFSVGGIPFAKESDDEPTERRFIDQIDKLLLEAPTTAVSPLQRTVVTGQMRRLRAGDLATRRAAYLTARIGDQHTWYRNRAQRNGLLARRWRLSLLTIEVIGICAALGKAVGYITFDLAGVVAAIIAAGAAWIGLKQHSTLARAYTFAANELAIAAHRLERVDDEENWAKEVADSEEAISREHTMWRASRSRASD